jgi:ATP-dependent Clp protease ATP-binding subunit ClpC
MEAKFSQRVKNVLTYSREEAIRLGNNYIGLEHLLLGIIRDGDGVAIQIMIFLNVDLDDLRRSDDTAIKSSDKHTVSPDNIPLIKQAERA